MSRTLLATLACVVAAACWAANAVIAAGAFELGVTPERLAQTRVIVALVPLATFLLLARRDLMRPPTTAIPALTGFGACIVAVNYAYYVAIDRVPVGVAVALQYTAPVLVLAGTAAVARRSPQAAIWLAGGLTLAGAVLVSGALAGAQQRLDGLGLIAGVAAALTFAGYPDDWYTNTEIGDTPACSWFSPTLFETDASGSVPDEIAIEIHVRETGLGQIPEWPRVHQETVSIGGYEASRMEDAIPRPHGGFDYVYHYAAWLDEDSSGLKVTAWTQSEGQSDYLLHKAVLDRLIGSLEFRDLDAEAEAAAKAESLFAETDTCTNPEAGYTVAFPEAWYTNTEIGQTPACSWFTPDFFEVPDSGEAPAEVWISIGVIDSALGYIGTTQVLSNGAVMIDGRAGRRVEFNPNPNGRPGYRAFHYRADLGETEATGPTFVASTDIDSADDYELAKAVLDRIMASLEFTD